MDYQSSQSQYELAIRKVEEKINENSSLLLQLKEIKSEKQRLE